MTKIVGVQERLSDVHDLEENFYEVKGKIYFEWIRG
jgi:cell fate regulator YaaT (PSP1 superfamily)